MSNKLDPNKTALLKAYAESGHRRPTTRREFLASGLLGFSATITAPSLLSMMTGMERAMAAGTDPCKSGTDLRLPAFVTLNLSGGAGLCGNYVALDQGGNLLPTYDVMGLGKTPPVVKEFGDVPFPGTAPDALIGKFLEGLLASAGPDVRAKTSFVAVCCRSQDDTGNNPWDISGLVSAAGLSGELLPNAGTQGTVTGVRQMYAHLKPPAPLVVNNFTDVTGSIAPSGTLAQRLSQPQRLSLLKLIGRLSDSQARQLASTSSGATLGKLVNCATTKNVDLAATADPGVDPRLEKAAADTTTLNTIWNINAGTGGNNRELIFGTLVYNALKGNAGAVGLELGGYDYHGQARATTDARDREAGQTVGRILASAHLMGKPVFIFVTSDGSVNSTKSDTPGAQWTGDRGTAGLAFMIAYDPSGKPATNGFQLGHFNKGQGADDQFVVGGDVTRAATAVFANYLKFAKRPISDLDRLIPRSFSVTELDQVLKFV